MNYYFDLPITLRFRRETPGQPSYDEVRFWIQQTAPKELSEFFMGFWKFPEFPPIEQKASNVSTPPRS